jgi:deoxyribodipyrimidine photo-lyase
MRGVVWLRRDLRLQDQPALTAACAECDDVIPLFVFDDFLLRARQFGAPCVTFMVSCLAELAGALSARGLGEPD